MPRLSPMMLVVVRAEPCAIIGNPQVLSTRSRQRDAPFGGLRLATAVVLEVWRRHRDARAPRQRQVEHTLSQSVRVMLLGPEKSAQAPYPFRCTPLAGIHFASSQRPACCVQFWLGVSAAESHLMASLSSSLRKAVMALQAAASAKVPYAWREKEGFGRCWKRSPDDLRNTALGRSNTQRYPCAMMHGPLTDTTDCVQFGASSNVLWSKL